jgi:hypothetical protein
MSRRKNFPAGQTIAHENSTAAMIFACRSRLQTLAFWSYT